MKHERRHADARQDRCDIDLRVQQHKAPWRCRGSRKAARIWRAFDRVRICERLAAARLIKAPVPQIFIRSKNASSDTNALAKPPKRMSFVTRSGFAAAKNKLIGEPSEIPRSTARCEPMSSIMARTSSTRCSSEGAPDIRVRHSLASLVEGHDAGENRETTQKQRIFGEFVQKLDMRRRSRAPG